MSTAIRRLRFFRIADNGERIPHIIELDSQLNFLREYRDVTERDRVAEGRRSTPQPEVSEERQKAMRMARWATESVIENPIPGTTDLRDAYFHDLKELHEAFRIKGESCPGCKIGELMRSYREKLESGGWLKQL